MLFNIFLNLRKNFRLYRTKKTFKKNSLSAPDTVFLPTALCQNNSSPENITIASHCTIGALFMSLFGGNISVGENSYIGPSSCIQSKESITIEKNVIIANNVIIVDNNNHPTDPQMRLNMSTCQDYINDELWSWKYADSAPIVIEENVWIGRDARILKGVTVGKGSIVAMGAIVTKDVPPYTIVAGNPAKVVKTLPIPEKAYEKN